MTCILPIVYLLAVSFSDKSSSVAGLVSFWPVNFTLASYKYIINQSVFWNAMSWTILRVVLGVGINFILTVLTAFPLSKEVKSFKARTFFVWFMFITTMISGGLIPYYLLIQTLGINDTIWALVLPSALPVFNVIILLNFFRQIPGELSEAAYMDGAGHFLVLFKIYLPISLPALATITLFTLVGHWNSWFDGLIYMDNPRNYPLSTYLHSIIVNNDSTSLKPIEEMAYVSEKTTKAAQIFVAMVPILAVYPFLQKYFAKGMIMGSVKG
jgi:putative aldouronate transport system permease protein